MQSKTPRLLNVSFNPLPTMIFLIVLVLILFYNIKLTAGPFVLDWTPFDSPMLKCYRLPEDPPTTCSHGYEDTNDCPDCCH